MPYATGKSYEQIEMGDTASFSKTISETDIYLFSGICGDFNPMHVNADYARQSRFKRRIAHGPLTQSLIAPILGTQLPGLGTIALELNCRFKAPVYAGDTITVTAVVAEKLPDKRWIRLKATWTNQDREIVAEGGALVIPPDGSPSGNT